MKTMVGRNVDAGVYSKLQAGYFFAKEADTCDMVLFIELDHCREQGD